MANTVFVLGAGASKLAGVPLMNDFLDVARDLQVRGKTGEYEKDFRDVFQGISRLQLVHSKSQLDIQNVESVFAAFEMAKTLGKFSDYTAAEIDSLVKSMQSLIVTTVQSTFKIPRHASGRSVIAPAPYDYFAKQVAKAMEIRNPLHSMAIITFNYDMGLDLAFHSHGVRIRYGLQDNEPSGTLPLLKLHGSLNWAHCNTCNKVVPWFLSDYFQKYRWDFALMDESVKTVTMQIGTHMKEYSHEGHGNLGEPMIVPPTWNKSGHHAAIAPVWALAAEQLSGAENIFVIGYSLPQSDAFFRLLYAIGTIGDIPLQRFWVFNPDESGETESRFKSMLGPGAIQRFRYYKNTFSESVNMIFDSILQANS